MLFLTNSLQPDKVLHYEEISMHVILMINCESIVVIKFILKTFSKEFYLRTKPVNCNTMFKHQLTYILYNIYMDN